MNTQRDDGRLDMRTSLSLEHINDMIIMIRHDISDR